jgi:hypothetical protein
MKRLDENGARTEARKIVHARIVVYSFRTYPCLPSPDLCLPLTLNWTDTYYMCTRVSITEPCMHSSQLPTIFSVDFRSLLPSRKEPRADLHLRIRCCRDRYQAHAVTRSSTLELASCLVTRAKLLKITSDRVWVELESTKYDF